MAPRLNSTVAEWHHSWMVPRLNGTSLPYGTLGCGRFVLMKRGILSFGEWLPTVLPPRSGSSSPYGHTLTLPDPEDKGVTIFRNVCVHKYLHKDTTSHPRRPVSLANLQWQNKISDRNTKFPDCHLCPSFCIFPYSNWRTGDWTSVNLLKPTGHVMHQQFNIQQLYALPTLYLSVLYLSENKQRLVPLTA